MERDKKRGGGRGLRIISYGHYELKVRKGVTRITYDIMRSQRYPQFQAGSARSKSHMHQSTSRARRAHIWPSHGVKE